ncbi:MAG: sensor histidine kinase [Rikenellaceae bacterium]
MREFNNRYLAITLQIIGWCVMLGITLMWSMSSETRSHGNFRLVMYLVNISFLMILYAINYLYIIPQFLFQKRKWEYFSYNALAIVVLLLIANSSAFRSLFDSIRPDDIASQSGGGRFYMIARELTNYILMVGLVTAIKVVKRLQQSEDALRLAESAKIEAELANLRSQINPHFLLNTLNNIYSLTAIDVEKSQSAIKELSRLLQYVLYDNRSDRVLLTSEVKFLNSYIELMRLRLGSNTVLDIEFKIDPKSETQIAPLLFISLIENAFKHGIKAGERSFIELKFEDRVQSGEIYLHIRNSNYATTQSDKSGHGVGLEQVRSRLRLLYAGMYEWNIDQSDDVYSSELIIKTK